MIIPEKRKAAQVIISKMGPDGRDEEVNEPSSDPLKDIAQDLINAVKSGSAEQAAMALQAAVEHCSMQPEEYEE